jgi:pilus assembly protein CpaB
MRKTAVIALLLGCVLGVFAVLMARGMLNQQQAQVIVAEPSQALPLTTVVVAARALKYGDPLAREYLREVNWPSGSTPRGAFTSVEKLLAGDKRVVLRNIDVDEPVLEGKISGAGGRATLSNMITGDLRAVTVSVNEVRGVAGFVLPGDRVDVLLTREDGPRQMRTDGLLQNLKVLGVDQETSDAKDKPMVAKAMTLEVTPAQAQKLVLAQQVGTLSLMLRNEANVAARTLETVRVGDLDNATPVGEPTSKITVNVVRGLAASVAEVLGDRSGRRAPARVRTTEIVPPPGPAISK